MLFCYLDDSDHVGGATMGIAGFVSRADQWLAFEDEVEPFLYSWGVRTLRGKDFQNGHGDFKGWNGENKRKFVDDLFQIAGKYVWRGVNTVVHKKYFYEEKNRNSQLSNLSPLGFSFAVSVHSILFKDEARDMFASPMSITFMVEQGNQNNGNLKRYFDWLKENFSSPTYRLEEIYFVGKHDCRAIQLADFLAFHGRREADRWARDDSWERKSRGHAMTTMLKHVFIRHNRMYARSGASLFADPAAVPDHLGGLIAPPGGLP